MSSAKATIIAASGQAVNRNNNARPLAGKCALCDGYANDGNGPREKATHAGEGYGNSGDWPQRDTNKEKTNISPEAEKRVSCNA